MGEVWPTAHITELCWQLTAGSRPVNGDEHRTLRSQSCERALLTTGTLPLPFKQATIDVMIDKNALTAIRSISKNRNLSVSSELFHISMREIRITREKV